MTLTEDQYVVTTSLYEWPPRRKARGERFEVRKAFHASVEVIAPNWDEPLVLEARDLSPAGAFVATQAPLAKGSELVVTFRVPTLAREISVFAVVARTSTPHRWADRGVSGMGIEFVDVSPIRAALHPRVAPRAPAGGPLTADLSVTSA